MRSPIWRIRAFVIVALLFWQCGQTATGPEQQTLRERLIGTWYTADQDSSEFDGVGIFRFRDDGIMTAGVFAGSYELQLYSGRWELEGDSLTLTDVRFLTPDEDTDLSEFDMPAMITFEDEALILTDPAGGERLIFQPGIPPQAIPEGNALHGTVTYSDGPYDEILVVARKFENEGAPPDVHGAAFLLVGGEWQILGLDDGVWFVQAVAFRDDTMVAGSLVVSKEGDVIAGVNVDPFMEEENVTIPFADHPGIPLEGGDQVVAGIDIVLRAFGTPVEASTRDERLFGFLLVLAFASVSEASLTVSGTAVEATAWGEVKARLLNRAAFYFTP